MNKCIIISFLFVNIIIANSSLDQSFYNGNNFYKNNDYISAISFYEDIIKQGWESSNLFYNLGNSYFRQNQLGNAIWSYKKGLMLDPRDKDLIHNLEIAKSRMIDKIIMPEEFIFFELYKKIKIHYSFYEWLIIGGFLILLVSIIFNAINILKVRTNAFKRVFYFFLIITFVEHLVIFDNYFEYYDNPNGIIIDNNVNAYSGPFSEENLLLFKLNEGTIAKIGHKQDNWVEINLLNGNRGWIYLEKIRIL